MNAEQIIFYGLATVMIVFSIMAVTSGRLLRSTIYLLFVLGATAGFYFMVGYEFLSAVQLMVYAGGIVVLIIFSVMLTSHLEERLPRPHPAIIGVVGFTVLAAAGLIIRFISAHNFVAGTVEATPFDVKAIGISILSYGPNGYVLPFEVISVLLLAAMIGAIVIAKRETPKGHE